MCRRLSEGLSPIDLAASRLDADLFELVVRLMVTGQYADLVARIYGHDCARVSNIDDVDHLVDNHNDGGAGAGTLRANVLAGHQVLSTGLGLFDEGEEVALALPEALSDGLDWILRELLVLHDEVVQVVAEVISACTTAVTVENTEEANLWPLDV